MFKSKKAQNKTQEGPVGIVTDGYAVFENFNSNLPNSTVKPHSSFLMNISFLIHAMKSKNMTIRYSNVVKISMTRASIKPENVGPIKILTVKVRKMKALLKYLFQELTN